MTSPGANDSRQGPKKRKQTSALLVRMTPDDRAKIERAIDRVKDATPGARIHISSLMLALALKWAEDVLQR